MNDFLAWLNSEIQKKGWSNNEFARRCSLSSSYVSVILSGKNPPTWDFCASAAEALLLPADEVFRRAGLLRPTNRPEELQTIVDIMKYLAPEDLDMLREIALLMYRRQ